MTDRPHLRRYDPARLVLGVVLTRPERLSEATDLLCEADFYADEHRRIWRAILAVKAAGGTPDHVGVGEWLYSNHRDEIFSDLLTIVRLLDPAELSEHGLLPLKPAIAEWAEEMRSIRRRGLRLIAGGGA